MKIHPISAILGKSGKKWVKVEWSAGAVRRSPYKGRVERMFTGQHQHTIDDKGRLTFPARFREDLGGGAFIIPGFDVNLMVLTNASFTELSAKLTSLSDTNPKARDIKRLMFSNACPLEFDKAGRVLLPEALRLKAQIEGSAVVAGVGTYLEIWKPDFWQQKENSMLGDLRESSALFDEFDITIE